MQHINAPVPSRSDNVVIPGDNITLIGWTPKNFNKDKSWYQEHTNVMAFQRFAPDDTDHTR